MGIARTAAAIALLLAPTGVVMGASLTDTGKAVEQHTSYVRIVVGEDEPDSPGYGAVAGLVTCQASGAFGDAVRWFDDQLLFRKGDRGPDTGCLEDRNATHIWATEAGAPDPRGNPTLEATGTTFEFTDPNNRHWVVREYSYHVFEAPGEAGADVDAGAVLDRAGVSVDGPAGNLTDAASNATEAVDAAGLPDVDATSDLELETVRFHTWVVETKAPTLDPTILEHYNFVTVVDFDKLTFGATGETEHTGEDGKAREGASHDASDPEDARRLPHEHTTAQVEVWAGPSPQTDRSAAEDRSTDRVTVLTPDEIDRAAATAGVDRPRPAR